MRLALLRGRSHLLKLCANTLRTVLIVVRPLPAQFRTPGNHVICGFDRLAHLARRVQDVPSPRTPIGGFDMNRALFAMALGLGMSLMGCATGVDDPVPQTRARRAARPAEPSAER